MEAVYTEKKFYLTRNGKSLFGIVLSDQADEIELFAAKELQKYIKSISQATLPIKKVSEIDDNVCNSLEKLTNTILLGGPENHLINKITKKKICENYPGPDGFIIKTVNDNLVLAGGNSRGTLYGVYTFLEKYLGVRWFYPTKEEEIIPRLESITIENINYSEKPSFKYRYFYFMEQLQSVGLGKAIIDWMGKNKMNYTLWSNTAGPWDNLRSELLPEFKKRGIQLDIGGHGFFYFVPPSHYFKDHPEWFSLVNGKRTSKGQLCLTEEEGISTLLQNVKNFIKNHPEIDVASLCMNDVWKFCECSNCTALPLFDNYMRVVNRLAREVRELDPKLKVSCWAYSGYINPPIKIRPEKNVNISSAFFGREYTDPMDAPLNLKSRLIIEKWLKVCKDKPDYQNDFIIYDYYPCPTMRTYRTPPLTKIIAADLRYYKKVGVDGVCVDATTPYCWWSTGLNNYVFVKMCWNVETDLEELLDDYYEKYYDKAAGLMREITNELEEIMPHTVSRQRGVRYLWQNWEPMVTRDWEEQCCPPWEPLPWNIPLSVATEAKENLELNQHVLETIAKCEEKLSYAFEMERDKTVLNRLRKAKTLLTYIKIQTLSLLYQFKAQCNLIEAQDMLNIASRIQKLEEAKMELKEAIKVEEEINEIVRNNRDLVFRAVTEKNKQNVMDKHPFHFYGGPANDFFNVLDKEKKLLVDSPGRTGEGIINTVHYAYGYHVECCQKWIKKIEDMIKVLKT